MRRPLVLALTLLLSACAPRAIILTRSRLLMGHVPVNVSIRTTVDQKNQALEAGEAAYRLAQKLESEISEYQPGSEISCLNRNAGRGRCPLSQTTLDLLRRSAELSKQSDHAFDIRFASKSPTGIEGKIDLLDSPPSGMLVHPDTRIGMGCIGKGWIVDRMLDLLAKQGFHNVLIDAGGDLRALGGPWKVAIQIPEGVPGANTPEIKIRDRALGSSGLYEQGHHILDPATQQPVDRAGSVTVEADNLTVADTLALAFFVMGEDKSRRYLSRFQNIKMIWANPDGKMQSYDSPQNKTGLPLNPSNTEPHDK